MSRKAEANEGERVSTRLMRRVIAWLSGIAVLLLALLYLGGGWYFSGQINQGALTVRHPAPDRSLRVLDATRDTVTLVETGEDLPALDTNLTYGLAWEGGYGQVSGPAEPAAGQRQGVTRRLTMLEGAPPRTGEMAGLERDSYPEDHPGVALGTTLRDVEYASVDNRIPAWFVPGQDDTWVILIHGGLGTDRTETLRVMRTSTALKLPSLAIAYRNDEDASGDPSGQYGYGRTEWRDLEGAVRYALDHGADDVVLVGYSMGGAITASFLERSDLAPRVSRVVLDAPMLDFETTIDYGASQRALPLIGQVPASLTWTAKQIAAVRYDVDWQATDYLDDSSWLTVPTLVFHGEKDSRVPLSTSATLAADHPRLVTLRTVKGAGHVEAWNDDPTAYDEALRTFLDQP